MLKDFSCYVNQNYLISPCLLIWSLLDNFNPSFVHIFYNFWSVQLLLCFTKCITFCIFYKIPLNFLFYQIQYQVKESYYHEVPRTNFSWIWWHVYLFRKGEWEKDRVRERQISVLFLTSHWHLNIILQIKFMFIIICIYILNLWKLSEFFYVFR